MATWMMSHNLTAVGTEDCRAENFFSDGIDESLHGAAGLAGFKGSRDGTHFDSSDFISSAKLLRSFFGYAYPRELWIDKYAIGQLASGGDAVAAVEKI